jgi:hypothetical protein
VAFKLFQTKFDALVGLLDSVTARELPTGSAMQLYSVSRCVHPKLRAHDNRLIQKEMFEYTDIKSILNGNKEVKITYCESNFSLILSYV